MRKNLLSLALAVIGILQLYSQELNAGLVSVEEPSSDTSIMIKDSYVTQPAIESILYNPAVYKKQLSRNSIQAIGYRTEKQEHFNIHFRKEQLHGGWKTFYSNNQLCDSGKLERNLPDGEWKTWYPNGQLKTVRNYSAEKYHYIKTDLLRNHPKLQRYVITSFAASGRNIAPYFKPDYDHHNSLNHPGSLLQKIHHNTAGNSSTYFPPFKNCLHHGIYINYYESGAVKDSGHYVNGLKHGLWKETMDKDSMYAFGFYNHGTRRGQWKYYHLNGELIYSEHYKWNGKPSEGHYFE